MLIMLYPNKLPLHIGVTYGGYGGYAYPPLFGVGGTVPPTFWAYDRKK